MPRAPKVCNHPDCARLQPCPEHAPAPWAGSRRRERTVSGSRQQRRARWVIAHYHGICHVCDQPGADEADHVIPLNEGGPDTLENMRPIHARPCHQEKTAAESARAKRS